MVVFYLWLVRHGQTIYNKKSIIQGQLDVPLSPLGFEQAKRVGLYFKHHQFTHVYSSDLLRARQTVEEIMKWSNSYRGMITYDSRMRERKFGECEGKTVKDLKQMAAQAGKSLADYDPPGGESLKQMSERIVSFFEYLCRTLEKESNQHQVPVHENDSVSSHLIPEKKKKIEKKEVVNVQEKKYAESNNVFQTSTFNETSANGTIAREESLSKCHNSDTSFLSEDQDDGTTTLPSDTSVYANVLLVSHGGFLKELMRHFFVDLGCEYHGEKESAVRITPNASVSKFIITLQKEGLPKVSCCLLHHKEHLSVSSEAGSDNISTYNVDDEGAF